MIQRSSSLPLRLATMAVCVCVCVAVATAAAQTSTSSAIPGTGVVLTKLSPPDYPPLARQARIMGDVKIQLAVRRDGSVESAEVVSGHPLLKQAAWESVQKSQFECRGCKEEKTSYSLTYAFELSADSDCCKTGPRTPEVTQFADRITIVAPTACQCDPAAVIRRVRSAKCLYLWKCGVQEEAVE